jgi:hypothetical protein
MERIITTKEAPRGRFTEELESKMREVNLSPSFNKKEKKWTLVKVPKSTTRNVAWHIRIDGTNILAVQVPSPQPQVSFYSCSDKAMVTTWGYPLAVYSAYVDLEAAVDKYYEENYTNKEANEEQSDTNQ